MLHNVRRVIQVSASAGSTLIALENTAPAYLNALRFEGAEKGVDMGRAAGCLFTPAR